MLHATDSLVCKSMISLKRKRNGAKSKHPVVETPVKCRCGGAASKPKKVTECTNRWIISCKVERCYAYNIGQGLADTIQGWNRLSTHFYR